MALLEAFQVHLDMLSQIAHAKIHGIIFSDQRSLVQDKALCDWHKGILKYGRTNANVIEYALTIPSHHSVGIQLADLIAGAVFRRYEHEDSRWHSLIKPKLKEMYWKEKDAESVKSRNLAEPAIMTQSQRDPHHHRE